MSYAEALDYFNQGRKLAILDQTVDSIHCLLKAVSLLDPMQGDDHRKLRAESLHQLGMVEIWRGRYGTAHDMLDEAVKLVNDNSTYWSFLIQACMGLEAHEKAIRCADKALQLSDLTPVNLHLLATAYKECGKLDKAEDCYKKAIELTPHTADSYYLLANCFYVANDKKNAAKYYVKALELEPNHADANYGYSITLTENLEFRKALPYIEKGCKSEISGHASLWSKALAHLILGEYEQGFKDHEVRFVFMRQEYGNLLAEKRFDKPPFVLNEKKGTVHVYSEQGFGDCLQFCRYVHELIKLDYQVIFEVDKSMLELMTYNFPKATVVPISSDYPGVFDIPECDWRIPLGSLMYVFRTTVDTIPCNYKYLSAPLEYQLKWAKKVHPTTDKKKVGICWAGGKRVQNKGLSEMDAKRSTNFETIKPLLDLKNCKFYSLQTGLAKTEINDPRIINLMDHVKGWADTAGFIENLDVVISVDTSVLHMAAAMGKETYLLNKHSTCWRWMLERKDSPWYNSLKISRPRHEDDWGYVVDNVKTWLQQ